MSVITITGGSFRNPERLTNALAQAFQAWAEDDINGAYWDDQFRDMGLWQYDRETRRKNGEIVGSPRDIYDTGALYESGIESLRINSSSNEISANWNWNARNSSGQAYARYVHEGEGTNYGNPRPWTDELVFPQKFDNSVVKKALLNKIKTALRS